MVATGGVGSSTVHVAGAVAAASGRPVVLVLAHLDEADEAYDELASAGVPVTRLPGLEVLPGETHVSLELFADRIAAVREVTDVKPGSRVIVAPIQALMQAVPSPTGSPPLARPVRRGQVLDPMELVRWLSDAGYKRLDAAEEPGDFTLRGGILDVFPAGGTVLPVGAAGAMTASTPVRIDFFGDEVDKITEVDPDTLGSGRILSALIWCCAAEEAGRPRDTDISFLELLPRDSLAIVSETMEVTEQGRGYYERRHRLARHLRAARGFQAPQERRRGVRRDHPVFVGAAAADVRLELPVSPLPSFPQDAAEAVKELASIASEQRVVVYCQVPAEVQRFQELVAGAGPRRGEENRVASRVRPPRVRLGLCPVRGGGDRPLQRTAPPLPHTPAGGAAPGRPGDGHVPRLRRRRLRRPRRARHREVPRPEADEAAEAPRGRGRHGRLEAAQGPA